MTLDGKCVTFADKSFQRDSLNALKESVKGIGVKFGKLYLHSFSSGKADICTGKDIISALE